MSLRALIASLEAEQAEMQDDIRRGFARARALVTQAFAARAAGDIAEARILLNEAIDAEFEVTGDAAVLGDLFDEWGGDYERDQRLPPGLQEGMASAARGEIEPFGDFSGHVEDEGEYEVIRPRSHLGSPMLFPVSHFLPSVNTDGECARCGAMHSKGPCP